MFRYFVIWALSVLAIGAAETPVIRSIEVEHEGAVMVSTDRILANIELKDGAPFSQDVASADVKRLYALGVFEEIRLRAEPVGEAGDEIIVIFHVRGPSPVESVRFTGNTLLSDGALKLAARLPLGKGADQAELDAARERIAEAYKKAKHPHVTVTAAVTSTEVLFTVHEQDIGLVRKIRFTGNQAFSAGELSGQMKIKDTPVLSRITRANRITSDQLQDDLAALTAYYRNHGYFDARVEEAERVPLPGRGKARPVELVIRVVEGPLSQVNRVSVTGNRAFGSEDLASCLAWKPSPEAPRAFSFESVAKDAEALQTYYGTRGYAEVRITPRLVRAGERLLSITYDVLEGKKFFVGRIQFSGNKVTKDRVLRNEMALQPGQVYNTKAVEASLKRLRNMGYFSEVTLRSE